MLSKIHTKQTKNTAIGEGREYLVSQYITKRLNWTLLESSFTEDVVYKIDLKASSKKHKLIYIQVKGFHKNWKKETFFPLVDKAKVDQAKAYVMYVCRSGKIYTRSLN